MGGTADEDAASSAEELEKSARDRNDGNSSGWGSSNESSAPWEFSNRSENSAGKAAPQDDGSAQKPKKLSQGKKQKPLRAINENIDTIEDITKRSFAMQKNTSAENASVDLPQAGVA